MIYSFLVKIIPKKIHYYMHASLGGKKKYTTTYPSVDKKVKEGIDRKIERQPPFRRTPFIRT